MIKKYLTLLVAFLVLMPLADYAHAAKKPKKPAPGDIVSASELFSVTVKAKLSGQKKAKNIAVSCRDKTGGKAVQKLNGVLFTSFARQEQIANWKLKYGSVSAKARKSLATQIANAKILKTKAKSKCKSPGFLGLAKYNGAWGEKQVRRLLEVFAFGGKESWVQPFVQAGLDATLDELFNFNKPDPYVDDLMFRLSCDPDPGDGMNECYPFEPGSDINDYYLDGLVAAVNIRAIYSLNPVRDVLFKWVMDNRAAVHRRPIGGCNRWMAKDFIAMVDRFTLSGDYEQYIVEYTASPQGHGKCLSGDVNHAIAPDYEVNEDYGRELVELVMFGPNDKDGNKNYTDADIVRLSRILSGLDETNNNGVCTIGYHPGLHFPGPTTVFEGTPFAVTIADSPDFSYPGIDLARALTNVKAKQLAYDLARELWPTFINDKATPSALQRLADIIEAENFNIKSVLKIMAASQAFYAAESDDTIVKDPYTFFVTYARMAGIPVENYQWTSSWFDDLGMRLMDAPTVFGWTYQLPLLTGDVFQLPRVNIAMYYALWQDFEDIETEYGWTSFTGLIQPAPRPTGDFVKDIVNHFVARLNLTDDVTEAELAQYRQFVNYYLSIGSCNQGEPGCFQVGSQWAELVWNPPNPIDTQDDHYRLKQVLMLLSEKPAFHVM